jgi:hypothetical protein
MPLKVIPSGWREAHAEARKLRKRVACETCGATNKRLHVHHEDGDWSNNELSNLKVLCGACHARVHMRVRQRCSICGIEAHGRGLCRFHYKREVATGDPLHTRKKMSSCKYCDRIAHSHGMCDMHYKRVREFGTPFKEKERKRPEVKKCSVCGEIARGRGLCNKHYLRQLRTGSTEYKGKFREVS